MPTPGADTVEFGGNTSCLELTLDSGRRLIFDAGTGIVPLGRQLVNLPDRSPIDLFLTHFHWDHIQGFPFFAPLADAEFTVRIHAETDGVVAVEELLDRQMRRPYCPVSLRDLRATLECSTLRGQPWSDDDVVVTPFRVRHPDQACGFRIASAGVTVVYIPDNEPEFPEYSLPMPWDQAVETFVRGADLLIHDAMFTREEYVSRHGWGHGTVDQAVRLAAEADVRRLLLFHHHPQRTDSAMRAIELSLAARSAEYHTAVVTEVAVEGRPLLLSAPKQL